MATHGTLTGENNNGSGREFRVSHTPKEKREKKRTIEEQMNREKRIE